MGLIFLQVIGYQYSAKGNVVIIVRICHGMSRDVAGWDIYGGAVVIVVVYFHMLGFEKIWC